MCSTHLDGGTRNGVGKDLQHLLVVSAQNGDYVKLCTGSE